MTFDKRFALLAENGDILFPYKKRQKSTNRFGFALNTPGEQDRHGNGTYTDRIEEVIQRLVLDGWSARVKEDKPSGRRRDGSLGIGKTSIKGYWVAPEFAHLVKTARIRPTPLALGS